MEQERHGVFPRVLWVAPDDKRAEQLRQVIGRTTDLTKALLVVTTSEQAIKLLAGGSA
jgi:hypothetical protein